MNPRRMRYMAFLSLSAFSTAVFADTAHNDVTAGAAVTAPTVNPSQTIQTIQLNQQYAGDIAAAQADVTAAQNAYNKCAQNNGVTVAGQNATNTSGTMNAVGNFINSMTGDGDTIGGVVNKITGADQAVANNAQRQLTAIKSQIDEYNNDAGMTVLTFNKDSGYVGVNEAAAEKICNNATANQLGALANHAQPTTVGGQPQPISVTDGGCSNRIESTANGLSNQAQKAISDIAESKKQADPLINFAAKGALAAGVAGMQAYATNKQNAATALGNKVTFQQCQMDQKAQLDSATEKLNRVIANHSSDLLLQQLQAQVAAQNGNNAPANGSVSLGDPARLAPDEIRAYKSGPSGGAGGGAGGGASGGGGGGSQASGVNWSFGSGKGGDGAGGGGLPQQPDAGTFASEGGGGGGGGSGSFGFGGEAANAFAAGAPGANGAAGAEGDAAGAAMGDGGINVLMSRARMRYANHAADLVKSVDLKRMASIREPASTTTKPVVRKRRF